MAQQQWLVKSSSRILGPYTYDQIVDGLHQREFVIIDEIALPQSYFWTLIRDQKEFTDTVEKLALEDVSEGENTEIISVTDIAEKRDPLENTTIEEPCPQKISPHSSSRGAGALEAGARAGTHEAETEYVYHQENSPKKDPLRIPLMITALLIVSSLCIIFYFKIISLAEEKQKKYETLLLEGKNLVHYGSFKEALLKYKEAYQLNPTTSDFHLYFGILLTHFGETVQARRILEDLAKTIHEAPEAKVKVNLALGLVAVMNGHYQQAIKTFDEVLPSEIYSASINKAWSLSRLTEYTQAYNLLTKLTNQDENPSLTLMLMAKLRIQLWLETKNENHLIQSYFELEKLIPNESDYYQESLFLRAYVQYLLGQEEQTNLLITQMFQASPYQTYDLRKNIFIHTSMMEWPLLGKWCQELVQFLNPKISGQILKAYCNFKEGDRKQAMMTIEATVEQNPENSNGLSLYSFMLSELSDDNKALVEVIKALKIEPQNPMGLVMRGRLCEKMKKWDCALESWSHLLNVQKNSLEGHAGLVRYHLSKGDMDQALPYYKAGSELNKNYIPLLKLEKKLHP